MDPLDFRTLLTHKSEVNGELSTVVRKRFSGEKVLLFVYNLFIAFHLLIGWWYYLVAVLRLETIIGRIESLLWLIHVLTLLVSVDFLTNKKYEFEYSNARILFCFLPLILALLFIVPTLLNIIKYS